MKRQSTRMGEIVEGDNPTHPSVKQRKEILYKALIAWDWQVQIVEHEPKGRFVKFTARTKKVDRKFNFEIYIFPNLANSARGRPDEMRIQLTRSYGEHRADFELDKKGESRCLLLGIYRLTADDVVICAWDAAAYREHANPNSCYVDIHAIAGAFRSGFDRSQDNRGRYVCCFRPEFMHFYIENMAFLHDVGSADRSRGIQEDPAAYDDTEGRLEGGESIIYYGAPGTGKSHTVNQKVGGKNCVRTVFHPDMQNSDFIGSLKPVMQEERVSYSFSPGPFALALRNALQKAETRTYLVIEELNRAPAAAVFGELFLLLDRDANGRGKYDVNFPTPEFRDWLCKELDIKMERIRLPSNLWLLATMNSADQGVYPIDTAFRRRWRQSYIPIDYAEAPTGTVNYVKLDGTTATIEWRDFARILNGHLTSKLSVAEDRLLGPWFVTDEDLAAISTIPGKVLIYLWDDLLRHHGREKVFDSENLKTYGEVWRRVESNERIFSDEFLNLLENSVRPEEA